MFFQMLCFRLVDMQPASAMYWLSWNRLIPRNVESSLDIFCLLESILLDVELSVKS